MKTVKAGDRVVEAFLKRPAFTAEAELAAARVLADIRRRGDAAVAACAKRFDGVALKPARFLVREEEKAAARDSVDRGFRKAVTLARDRVARFARAGMKRGWRIRTGCGGELGEQFTALDRVGVYIPAGAAPLASTAIMTVTLAKVAGVPEIVACAPCGRDGLLNPYLLYAVEASGATEVYKVGGIQAIGMLAYGTRTCPKVQKIVGPGGAFVTAAKRQVYGSVALDMVAGPSEIAVLADDSANPAWVAADLLSQAEHGTGHEKVLLVTPSRRLAARVRAEVAAQTAAAGRRAAIERVLARGALIVLVPDLDAGVDLCNRFAPEHLELAVRRPEAWLRKVRAAGAVFLGPWTPEAAGDYVAGPSHVLPTGGAAAMFSGLTVDDFLRRTSVVRFSRADLAETLPAIVRLAGEEGLQAHARSAAIRFDRA